MTQLRERPEIREVPRLERPRRPWFGWIVSLLVLVVAGGIWLIARDGDTVLDGSFEFNEQARFERIGAQPLDLTPLPDASFDLNEQARFERIGAQPFPTMDGFDLAEFDRFERIGAQSAAQSGSDGFDYAEYQRFMRLRGES